MQHVLKSAHNARLLQAIALGAISGLAFFSGYEGVTRFLLAWNVTIWSYLILLGILMFRASTARVRTIAASEDRGVITALIIMSTAAIASLSAIVLELNGIKDLTAIQRLAHYSLTASTVVGSWLMVATMFTFHYAHAYYNAPATKRPLVFPCGETQPMYWDFLYFSFTIAIAAQTSDIEVWSRSLRKTVLYQSLVSFLFNIAILGLSINIAASLVGS